MTDCMSLWKRGVSKKNGSQEHAKCITGKKRTPMKMVSGIKLLRGRLAQQFQLLMGEPERKEQGPQLMVMIMMVLMVWEPATSSLLFAKPFSSAL